MARIDALFERLKSRGGSDLHLVAGIPPRYRLRGDMIEMDGSGTMEDGRLRRLLKEIASQEQWERFEADHDLDFAYGLAGVGRFRANFFEQQNGVGAVFRLIPEDIVELDELGLPEAAIRFVHLDRGLVLVTGPTGSGKSTTLASIVNEINGLYSRHIVTIEDPIEFIHRNRKSVVSQREVGPDAASFGSALRAAIRQDASVILVGEMRDLETVSLTLTAAEMGMLVFGTLHTSDVSRTVDRVVDVFPAEQQPQARSMLAGSLAGVILQALLRTADGKGRVGAFEVLSRTPGLGNVIREGNIAMINSIIQGGRKVGMQTMDDALFDLAERGVIDPEDAYVRSADKKRFSIFAPEPEQEGS